MLVQEILNTQIAPLKPADTAGLAITKLDLLHTAQFPVVDNDRLIGMISIDALTEVDDEKTLIATLPLGEPIAVPASQHLFEAARQMLALELYLLPVVGEDRQFLGVIKKRDVLHAISEVFNLESFGSVITVEMIPQDFTLAEIVRLIETEGAKILGVAVEQPSSKYGFYRVSIKLNFEDSSIVTSALSRHGYVVTSQVSSANLEKDFSERADELIRYLDI